MMYLPTHFPFIHVKGPFESDTGQSSLFEHAQTKKLIIA